LELDLDDRAVVIKAAPLALNAQDPVADLERQVVALVIDDRPQH
jgi:hypothetical protein